MRTGIFFNQSTLSRAGGTEGDSLLGTLPQEFEQSGIVWASWEVRFGHVVEMNGS